jgi:hypothetical protein
MNNISTGDTKDARKSTGIVGVLRTLFTQDEETTKSTKKRGQLADCRV